MSILFFYPHSLPTKLSDFKNKLKCRFFIKAFHLKFLIPFQDYRLLNYSCILQGAKSLGKM